MSGQFFHSFWHAVWRSARHEGRFLQQHRWDFAMLFWLPIMFVCLVWWVFSKGTLVGLPIAVIDHSHSSQSSALIRYLDASPEISVVAELPDRQAERRAIESTQVFGVVEIPDNFADNLLSGGSTRVLLNVNAQYGTHSGMIQKGVQTAVSTYSAKMDMGRRVAKGEAISLVQANFAPIQTQAVTLYNPSNNYQQFLAVTVIPALLHILSMVIGASVVGRELRDKSLGSWYADIGGDPAKPRLALLIAGLNGKLIWAMLAYTLWGAVALSLVTQVYPVSLPSLAVTYANFLLFMMVSFWLGVIVTVGTFSYRQGLSFTGFISAPSFAFSGVTFPFIAMSVPAQRWANALPLTHYLRVQTPQLQMNAPFSLALPSLYGFMLAVAICLCLSAILTKRALLKPEKWGQR